MIELKLTLTVIISLLIFSLMMRRQKQKYEQARIKFEETLKTIGLKNSINENNKGE